MKTNLTARRGAFSSNYRDTAYIVDAITNNPGAAGGAITDSKGRLIGLIGKELKDENMNTWLNYAIPIERLRESVDQILSGKMAIQSQIVDRRPTEPVTLELLGIIVVPDVAAHTPPFVERTIVDLPARRIGILPDDLIVEINGHLTPNIKEVHRQLSQIDRDNSFEMTIQRDEEFLTIRIGLLAFQESKD